MDETLLQLLQQSPIAGAIVYMVVKLLPVLKDLVVALRQPTVVTLHVEDLPRLKQVIKDGVKEGMSLSVTQPKGQAQQPPTNGVV